MLTEQQNVKKGHHIFDLEHDPGIDSVNGCSGILVILITFHLMSHKTAKPFLHVVLLS